MLSSSFGNSVSSGILSLGPNSVSISISAHLNGSVLSHSDLATVKLVAIIAQSASRRNNNSSLLRSLVPASNEGTSISNRTGRIAYIPSSGDSLTIELNFVVRSIADLLRNTVNGVTIDNNGIHNQNALVSYDSGIVGASTNLLNLYRADGILNFAIEGLISSKNSEISAAILTISNSYSRGSGNCDLKGLSGNIAGGSSAALQQREDGGAQVNIGITLFINVRGIQSNSTILIRGGAKSSISNVNIGYSNSHSHGANHDYSQYQCEYFFHCDFLL